MPVPSQGEPRGNDGEGVLEEALPGQEVDLDKLEATILKGDEQKADDAEVPVQIWEQFFLDTMPKGFPPLHPDWRKRLNSYRELGIIFWRQCLRKSFWWDVARRVPVKLWRHQPLVRETVYWDHAERRYRWTKLGRTRYRKWLKALIWHPNVAKDWEPARECFTKAANATWWEWAAGSRLFFWNWPPSFRTWARDGQDHYLTGDLPKFTRPQQAPRTPEDRVKCWQKLFKVRERRYIDSGPVTSLMHMFYVPKGKKDIRMVYNGTASGINDCLFAPHFSLPTVAHVLRALDPGFYQADLDIGEMFLNFMLGEELRPYSGVDVTHVKTRHSDLPLHEPDPLESMPEWEKERVRAWERWVRNWMGLTDSPHRSIQMMMIAKEMAQGSNKDRRNPFQWEKVVLNLPGSRGYNPKRPWVYKMREDGKIANDAFVYVDDNKSTGSDKVQSWRTAGRFSAQLSNLGIQDASRKRTTPSEEPGPWAGSVVHTKGGIYLLVSQNKWEKAKSLVEELRDMMGETGEEMMDHKRLQQIRGFLIYVSRTYDWMPPYLKGLHNTIDGWRPGRDGDGFKAPYGVRKKRPFIIWEWEEEVWLEITEEEYAELGGEGVAPPAKVRPVPRLRRDVEALMKLMDTPTPALTLARPTGSVQGYYLMGDASGKGFGSALWDSEGIFYESGHYGERHQRESSNFREADNLVRRIERMEVEGKLREREVFIFTDNSSFEGTFYKGHSTSVKLCDIILRLRQAQRKSGAVVHVVHVAGTRMKEAGIDGLSRGDLLEGMMRADGDPWEFLPLSQGAGERAPGFVVKEWVDSWWGKKGTSWCGVPLTRLSPKDWFDLKSVSGPRLWMPPPAAMVTVLEMFNEDRLIRPHLPHVFVVPRLMTHLWRKQLTKDADVVFTVPCGTEFWPASMHEPLLVLIVFPLTHVRSHRGPWVLKGTDAATKVEDELTRGFKSWGKAGNDPRQLHELDSSVQGMWENSAEWSRAVLLKFLDEQREFPPVRECLVRGMLCRVSDRPFPSSRIVRRRGRDRAGPSGGEPVSKRQKR